MGFLDFVTEVYSSLSVTEVYAEAPEQSEEEGGKASDSKDKDGEEEGESEGGEDGGEDGGDDGGEEEEEEEEEEEPEDIKPKLEEECMNSKQCASYKHHYDECAERVQKQEEDGKAKEDCVEEFFHLMHCATACAAPKLWAQLK